MCSYYITLLFLGLLSSTLAANCYGPSSKLVVTQFDAFPSPVAAGDTIFVRTILSPTYDMGSSQVTLNVYYTDQMNVNGLTPIITVGGLNLCNISTGISCPLTAGSHILSWEYRVPDILPGTYQVVYTILEDVLPPDGNPYSCIQFAITVSGTAASSFTSWYQATLLGTAIFTQPDYTLRQVGEIIQVGPAGPLNGSISPVPNYGSIKFLSGSGDLVPNAFYDTSSFVWGLWGTLTKQSIGPNGQVSHTYEGEKCYLGYINNQNHSIAGNFYDYTTSLFECDYFMLNYTYTDSTTAQVSGYATFYPSSTLPYGWGFPMLYGRLPQHQVVTTDEGFLMIQGSLPFCATGTCASPPPPGGSTGSGGLSSEKLGLAIGLPIAAVFVIVLILAALLYLKKRRETEQEDGIFAVSRKPEYGSALVVDGIIEETMGSKTMQAMLDGRDEDDDASEGESGSEGDEDDAGSRGVSPRQPTSSSRGQRQRSRTRSLSPVDSGRDRDRSRSGDRSMGRSRSNSRSDPGESASRGSDSE